MNNDQVDYRIALNETNVIKAIAICAMLWHHLFYEHPEYGNFVFKLALTGKVCVALFVFLSGYGMAVQYQRRNVENNHPFCSNRESLLHGLSIWLRFLARRFSNFYLNYWFVFLVTVPIGIFVFGRTLADAYGAESSVWVSLLTDVLGLRVFESYNITWWVNRLFLSLWLVFPFLYWSMNSRFVSFWMLILLYLDPGSILFPLEFLAPGMSIWLISFALGIFTALNGTMLNIYLNKVNRNLIFAVFATVALALLYMRNNYVLSCFCGMSGDPLIALFLSLTIVCLCRLTKRNLKVLAFVGKHSMNMYLTHTFILGYFFHNFIYSFKNPLLIFAVLFSISLFLSMVLEFFKKIIGFYRLQDNVKKLFD